MRSLLSVMMILSLAGMASASDLPVCSNRIINEVTKRAGCTVGDSRCWLTKGGFCTDYIEQNYRKIKPGKSIKLEKISENDVKKGDVAQFNSRAHYAYIESVVKGKDGKPVALNLSEYNYGVCWVDEENLVTEKYKIVNKRRNVPLSDVDGGFLRPQ